MYNYTGWIAQSIAGHDKQGLFYVVGCEGEYLLLANGKQRKLIAPKKKKRGHVVFLCRGDTDDPTAIRLRRGEPVSNRELRRALAACKGGNHAWQKTI